MGLYDKSEPDTFDKVTAFQTEYDAARKHMKAAAEALLKIDPDYSAVHKKMVRLIRDWNRIEQEREPSKHGSAARCDAVSDEGLARLIAEHLPSPYSVDIVFRQTNDGAEFDLSQADDRSRDEWMALVRLVKDALSA